MVPIPYYTMIRATDHTYSTRLAMVLHARAHGVRATARQMGCARNTVRLWLRRFTTGGRAALRSRSCAPRRCPHKTSAELEAKVLAVRRRVPCFGPRRLKDLFGLAPSHGAIARILRAHRLSQPRRRRRQRKNDLRAIKAAYPALTRLQMDTKPLYDIPHYWPQMTARKLPRQLYDLRDVKSGAVFADFGNELSATYAALSIRGILHHLRAHGLPLDRLVLSTDNGSEFGGQEKHTRRHGFPAVVRSFEARHVFIPPATPNAHADIESFHSCIEREFFDLEHCASRQDFFAKATTYLRWWNFARPNYSKGKKTPAQLLEEEGLDPILLFRDPLDLDATFRTLCSETANPQGVGQEVPALPGSIPMRRAEPPGCACRAGPSAPRPSLFS